MLLWSEIEESRRMLKKPEQMEFDAVSDHEAFVRHKEAMARRAFAWYRLCKDPEKNMKLIDTYNRMSLLGKKKSR